MARVHARVCGCASARVLSPARACACSVALASPSAAVCGECAWACRVRCRVSFDVARAVGAGWAHRGARAHLRFGELRGGGLGA
eukprot:6167963-Pleurochrysis_carterae.AAC.2